ncbi:Abp1p LALA0_S02e06436g [Lachancea lanzarotensis]|uniref:LALA0S02e06436g1_1 n=1 Tax=Lachancea lanzarotensis TaxID=1245769 RepID=A0A0C7MZQ3_9SACH|nr:uncharacterized protein LALA0_S02e06436g [Lachancea lanzarotensis]CEP61087.1 LALA0S02e06436g1_1 [Lachancea lanzarotensis]
MALEPIDYTTHCHAIEEAFQKVVRASDDEIDWLILTPNGQKQYIPDKLGSGFSEFLGSFEESKVEYGLARVSPPGSDVQKLVLVGWCPDNAPLKTRASFASNFGVVANQVLKSYHIQVTARDEDDLDEKELLNKVSNAAGARYSIQNEIPTKTSSAPKPRPSSVPKKPETTSKPVASRESAPTTKKEPPKPAATGASKTISGDDDWDEPEVEERDLDVNPLKPNKSSWNPVGKVDLQKLVAEEKSKVDPRLVNTVKSESPSKLNPKDDIEKLRQQSKAQRDAEMNKYLGTKPSPVVLPKKSDDLVVKGFQNEKSPAQIWAEKHQQKTNSTSEKVSDKAGKSDEAGEDKDVDESAPEVSDIKSKFEKLNTAEPAIIKPGQARSPPPSTKPDSVASTGLPIGQKKPIGNPLPGMQTEIDSESEEEAADDDDWDDDDDDKATVTATNYAPPTQSRTAVPAPAPAPRPVAQTKSFEKAPSPASSPKPTEAVQSSLPPRSTETTFVPPPPPRRNVPAATQIEKEPEQPVEESEPENSEEPASTEQEKLPSAIAEYDNEAEEHNELAFSEGDKIVNIVFVDDEWWLGELEATGEKGLFPSNYVQLVD